MSFDEMIICRNLEDELVKISNSIERIEKKLFELKSDTYDETDKFNLDEFDKGKLAVNFKIKDDVKVFVAYLIGKGRSGSDIINLLKIDWEKYGAETCCCDLWWCDKAHFRKLGCKIWEFDFEKLK